MVVASGDAGGGVERLALLDEMLSRARSLDDSERTLLRARCRGRGRREIPPMKTSELRSVLPRSPRCVASLSAEPSPRRTARDDTRKPAVKPGTVNSVTQEAISLLSGRRLNFRQLSNGKSQLVATPNSVIPALRETKPLRLTQASDEPEADEAKQRAPEEAYHTAGTSDVRQSAREASVEAFTLELLMQLGERLGDVL